MNDIKVSIITPAYNAEKYIGQTIQSVLDQTYEKWEMLIYNDKSADGTQEIISKYAEKDGRIKYVNANENLGVVEARNRLIEMARGEYIAFLDADDYWACEKLERQIGFMETRAALISCSNYTRVQEDGRAINEIEVKDEISYEDMLKNNYMGCLTVIYNCERLGKRYFKERDKNEDYALWLEIIRETGSAYGLRANLAYYRVLGNSRSSNKLKAAKDRWKIYREAEKLSLIKSIYYFVHYAFAVLKKQNQNKNRGK